MKRAEVLFFLLSLTTITFSVFISNRNVGSIFINKVHLTNTSQIIPLNDSLVVPVLYDTLVIDENILISEQKKQFINQVLPAILIVNYKMEIRYKKVESILDKYKKNNRLSRCETKHLDTLMLMYKARSYENLLVRLKPQPTSLVLAQAAVESGWGHSRFAVEGNNLFGIWTGAGDPNSLKSTFDRGDKKVFVKRYNTLTESIEHYYLTIGRHKAYRKFRIKRFEEADVYQLIDELISYSENGEEYAALLKHIVRWNKLEQYDNYMIDPAYISSPNRNLTFIQDSFIHIKNWFLSLKKESSEGISGQN